MTKIWNLSPLKWNKKLSNESLSELTSYRVLIWESHNGAIGIYVWLLEWKNQVASIDQRLPMQKQWQKIGARHSLVDSSAPSILRSRIRSSMLFPLIAYLSLSWEKDENKQKAAGIGSWYKSNGKCAATAQWIRLRLPSCHPGSSPKHTIYAFIIYRQICAVFVSWKQRKTKKRPGMGHFNKVM